MEVTTFGRVAAVPSTAHDLLTFGSTLYSGKRNGSIICPSTPSAKTKTTMRHFWANSKAFMVKSHISCTLAGARTMLR